MSERLSKLLSMLEQSPTDPFLLYATGMEYKKLNDYVRAIEYFRRTISADPKYCYAYFQLGQTLELENSSEQAKQAYKDGVAAAQMAGDEHARGEIRGAMDMME